jgi:aspartate aminotransferase, mitochondrial
VFSTKTLKDFIPLTCGQKFNLLVKTQNLTSKGLDAIKQLTINFQKDPHPGKVLLGEGVYRDNEGKPVILESVRKAEEIIFNSKLDHGNLCFLTFLEYAPVGGVQKFCDLSKEFAFGKNSKPLQEGRIATVQTISGTGSLRLAGMFLNKFLPAGTSFYVPAPTWFVNV